MWRRYLKLAYSYAAAHRDGIVKHTGHELRHVCASLLIASGTTDMRSPASTSKRTKTRARPRVPLGRV
jgi:hypothetical protein